MKLRFAPSPTGFLHVGGARTAIFNLLHARRYGGTMLLRIEDTDVERSRQHHAEQNPETPHVIRFRVEPGPIDFLDLIRGDVHFEGELIDDFVLLRSDGFPTYHLSVVVDDIDMEITHVARGDDHLSNTPKHVLLFRAFGAESPVFAHLPLILGSDRKRLSKRTGATSAEEYRDMGIVPDALFNFLMLLGWSPGGDREIFSKEDAAATFDLSDVNKAPAVFDSEKLLWMNGQYLMRMTPEEIYPHLLPFLPERRPMFELLALIELYQKRARTLREMAEQMNFYFLADDVVVYEAEAAKKHLRGDGLEEALREMRDLLASTEPFDVAATEKAVRAVAERRGIGAGKLIHPLRLALTGRGASPPVF